MQHKRKKTEGRGRVQAYSLLRETPRGEGLITNDCLRYRHLSGYAYPRTPDSCRGCMYSYDPALYDPGCTHPQGVLPRKKRKAEAQTSPRISAGEGGATGPGCTYIFLSGVKSFRFFRENVAISRAIA